MQIYGFTVSAKAHPTWREIRACANESIDCVEIEILPKYAKDIQVRNRVRRYIHNHGIIPSVHSAYDIQNGSTNFLGSALEWARCLDAEIVTMHSSRNLDDRFIYQNANGVELLVENSYYLYKLPKIRDYVANHNLDGITFNAEKFAKTGVNISDAFRQLSPLVKHMHCSNVKDGKRVHLPLGEGIVTHDEWKHFFEMLVVRSFHNTIVFDTREFNYSTRERFSQSLEYFENLMEEIYFNR